jgi:putative heme-binding domain-containing protein
MSASLDAPLRKQIERRRQQTRDYRLTMRLSTLLWRDDGKTQTEIAHLLGICTRTVRHWLRLYRTKGLDALCTLHYQGDRGELTASQAEHLRAEIQTGRFRLRDLCESIVEPGKVISDQYRASIVTTNKGKEYVGRIISETKDTLTILLDPEDSTKVVEVKKSDVDEQKPSPVSVMPEGLLKALSEDEVLDLIAYLLSRGDRNNPMFKK